MVGFRLDDGFLLVVRFMLVVISRLVLVVVVVTRVVDGSRDGLEGNTELAGISEVDGWNDWVEGCTNELLEGNSELVDGCSWKATEDGGTNCSLVLSGFSKRSTVITGAV